MKLKHLLLLLIILPLVTSCSNVSINPDTTITTDLNLNKIHTGETYATSTTLNINSGQTKYIKANSTTDIHLLERRIFATTTGTSLDYTVNLYENGYDLSSSSKLNVFNVHRGFPENNTFNIYTTVNSINLINSTLLPFGNKAVSDKKYSSTAVSTTEYILASNTSYYLGITNNDGGVLTVDLFWQWYAE